MTCCDGVMDIGNNGMGVCDGVVGICNSNLGVCNIVMDVGNDYVCVYRKFSLEVNG